jgi:hypothetical protein
MDDFLSEKGKAAKAKVEACMAEATPKLIPFYENTEFPQFMVSLPQTERAYIYLWGFSKRSNL